MTYKNTNGGFIYDKNGTQLKVGDRVTVEFRILSLMGLDEQNCDLSLETVSVIEIDKYQDKYAPKIKVNSKQVVSSVPTTAKAKRDDQMEEFIYELMSNNNSRKDTLAALANAVSSPVGNTEPLYTTLGRAKTNITDEQYDSVAEGILSGHISASVLDDIPEDDMVIVIDKIWNKSREEDTLEKLMLKKELQRYQRYLGRILSKENFKRKVAFIKNQPKESLEAIRNHFKKNCLADELVYMTESDYNKFNEEIKKKSRQFADQLKESEHEETKPVFQCPGWGYTDFLIGLLETGRISKEMRPEIRNKYVDIINANPLKYEKLSSLLKKCISRDVEAVRSAIRDYNKFNEESRDKYIEKAFDEYCEKYGFPEIPIILSTWPSKFSEPDSVPANPEPEEARQFEDYRHTEIYKAIERKLGLIDEFLT